MAQSDAEVPLRRSTRASSAKPTAKPAPAVAEKLAAKSRAKKRAASPEQSPSPPPKRTRTANGTRKAEPERPVARKASSRSNSKAGASRKPRPNNTLATVPEAPVQTKPYFNPLPPAPKHERPGLLLFAWGAGNFGQFGMGPDFLGEQDKPKRSVWAEQQIQTGTFGEIGAGLESIVAGGLHSLFIDEKGTVWSCGVNDDAALGRITQNVPDPNNPGGFLDVDELVTYPHPLQTLVDEGFRTVQLASGDSICAALSSEGDLRVWGSFRVNEGSLGFANGLKHQFLPVPFLENLSHKPGDYEKVTAIAAGSNHLLVLTTHGSIYTWGAGEQSQLGRKVLERRKIHGTTPEKVTLGNRARKAIKVGAGSFHSFAVDESGDVWGWGLNSMGQIGTGYETSDDSVVQLPQKVKRLSKEELSGDTVVEIKGGSHHTLFLTAGGKVYACGRSNAGQLGLPDDDPAFNDRIDPDFLPEPTLVTFPEDDDPVVQISCGPHNNLAITAGGALYAWGQGTQGELGVPDVEVRIPKTIVRRDGGSWSAVAVACGGQHTLGLFRSKK